MRKMSLHFSQDQKFPPRILVRVIEDGWMKCDT